MTEDRRYVSVVFVLFSDLRFLLSVLFVVNNEGVRRYIWLKP